LKAINVRRNTGDTPPVVSPGKFHGETRKLTEEEDSFRSVIRLAQADQIYCQFIAVRGCFILHKISIEAVFYEIFQDFSKNPLSRKPGGYSLNASTPIQD